MERRAINWQKRTQKSRFCFTLSRLTRVHVCEVRISLGKAKEKSVLSSFFTFIKKMYRNGRGEMLLIICGSVSTGRKNNGAAEQETEIWTQPKTRRKEKATYKHSSCSTASRCVRFYFIFFYCVPPTRSGFCCTKWTEGGKIFILIIGENGQQLPADYVLQKGTSGVPGFPFHPFLNEL